MTRRKTYQKGSVSLHNGNWTLRYHELDHTTHTRKQRREVLGKFKDKKAALSAAAPIMARVNEANNMGPSKLHAVTFEEFIEVQWKQYSVNEQHQASTVDTYTSLIENHLLPVFGKKKCGTLSRWMWAISSNRNARKGFPRTPWTCSTGCSD